MRAKQAGFLQKKAREYMKNAHQLNVIPRSILRVPFNLNDLLWKYFYISNKSNAVLFIV